MAMKRKQNFQPVAWFNDLVTRERLDLDPPYQRRSVWNQSYRDYFIDTVLLGYPAPAIFLYEEISAEGVASYHVIDGKQRLITLFSFARNEFPVHDSFGIEHLRGLYFKDLPPDVKQEFWSYQFSVEYVPSTDSAVINNIFDRINRNTLKLTQQELRHAKLSGEFISAAESLAEQMESELGLSLPNIAKTSRKQMKDVELVAQLLLLLESGPKSYSTSDLDEEFSKRDEGWENGEELQRRLSSIFMLIKRMNDVHPGKVIERTRLKNQADFYSLVGALHAIMGDSDPASADVGQLSQRLTDFAAALEDDVIVGANEAYRRYLNAARAASNDQGPRQTRIEVLIDVLTGNAPVTPAGVIAGI